MGMLGEFMHMGGVTEVGEEAGTGAGEKEEGRDDGGLDKRVRVLLWCVSFVVLGRRFGVGKWGGSGGGGGGGGAGTGSIDC